MEHENTCWRRSVAAVCIKDGSVMLARHTYGPGKGKLIIPGGYLNMGEMPEDAVKREFLEEVGVVIEPKQVIGIRFNSNDWYVIFSADYVSGQERSDGDENDEVIWMPIGEALGRDDVPDLTKTMIKAAMKGTGMELTPYIGRTAPYSLYI